ncbi:hypothetical protein CCE28_18330 [Anaeromicrobium sediminis]|uniref:Uncharacterized protein n=1 Tax=Anaeromicrobium sediminis TaxID=1478221 RepID=A0A267MFP1_9FIRM|nr:hypothetical protein CCE28_18330 [Anaeromicrobium sediminis]
MVNNDTFLTISKEAVIILTKDGEYKKYIHHPLIALFTIYFIKIVKNRVKTVQVLEWNLHLHIYVRVLESD